MSILSLVKVPLGKPREFFPCLLSSPCPPPPQHSSSKEAAAYTFPNVSVAMLCAHGRKPTQAVSAERQWGSLWCRLPLPH